MTKSKFRPVMITDALQAEDAMRDTPLAGRLKSNGFTPAVMGKEANELTDLHTQAVAARNVAAQATADLAARAEVFIATYSRYSNLIRALTADPGLRRKHGVKTPGLRKGPLFKRPRKDAPATGVIASAPAVTASTSTPLGGSTGTNGYSSNGSNGLVTSVVGHA